MIAKLKPKAKRYALPDPEFRGFYVRVTPAGAKSFCAVTREPGGKQVWATIGATDHYGIKEARERAREAIKRIRDGQQPFKAPPVLPDSFAAVAENYMQRHVEAKGLRSKGEIKRILDQHILPTWAGREFEDIRRGDVTKLLDGVQDASGPSEADHVLAIVRGVMNWYMSRVDDYVSPIARGMRRTDPKSRKRTRILDDEELRLVWKQAEANGTFGAIIRLALLTAQRRAKVSAMRWEDVDVDGTWHIPAEDREKGTPGALVLPDVALTIIRAQQRIEGNPYVFAGRGSDGFFCGWSPSKRTFDKKLAEANGGAPLENWTLHDLRRTARSLLSRAGVRPDISERVLGHVIAGIEGVYDLHSYTKEKATALKQLAAQIEIIVDPPANNVVAMRGQPNDE
jgi:integrase